MNNSFTSLFLRFLVAIGTGLGSLLGLILLFQNPQGRNLFQASPIEGDFTFTEAPAFLQKRYVLVDFALLHNAHPGDLITLNLFDGVVFRMRVAGVETSITGNTIYTGKVDGVAQSQVVLVVGGGQLSGSLWAVRNFYQVRFAGKGIHLVSQVEQSWFPEEAEPLIPEMPAGLPEGQAPLSPSAPQDDGSVIDVLVAYTTNAKNQVGGTTQMLSKIDQAVAEANQSYANSGITQRLNLVHTVEYNYEESASFSTDLQRITGTNDGYMDGVHTLRNDYYADEVSLIRTHVIGLPCGIAWLMYSVSTSFAPNAFSVVDQSCATGYYSFAHELGHNMGTHHDWYVNTTVLPYPYNHGYVYRPSRWRTIMAYNNECSDSGYNCTRLQYWANPNVLYGGVPMGVPAGTNTTCAYEDPNHPPCDADNRLVLNNTAWTVANFRVRPGGVTPTPTATATRTPTPTPTSTATATPTATATSGPVSPPWLLLVDDDDNAPDVRSYYTAALDALGVAYDIWNTANSDNEPSAANLANYPIVVWFTGDEFGGAAGPGAAGESALQAWLDQRGCFLISSQDYFYDRGLTSFMVNYLGVGQAKSDVTQTQVQGQGSVFGGLGLYSLSYPFTNYSDTITPTLTTDTAFVGNKLGAAAFITSSTFRASYWGFPLESLPTASDRQNALAAFIGWCQKQAWLPLIVKQ